MGVFVYAFEGSGAFFGSSLNVFFQAPESQRAEKQMARQSQSAIIAHQTPAAPQPSCTHRTNARDKRKTAMEAMLVYMGKALSLAARRKDGRRKARGYSTIAQGR